MDTISVDLNTRIIGPKHSVFVARPGENFTLYEAFRDAGAIGPDLPALGLRRGTVFSDQKEVPARIRRALKLRQWHLSGRDPADEPDRSLDAYGSGGRVRSLAQYTAALSGYFEKALKGDLVIIAPRAWAQNALVVEFTGTPDQIVHIPVSRYGKDHIAGREFKILAEIERRRLPGHVLDIIGKPNIFVMLGRSERPFFYNLAYESYVYGNDISTRFNVTTPDYKADDDLYISAFLKFAAVNTSRVSMKNQKTVKSVGDAIFVDLGELSPDLKTNVNSPGFIQFHHDSIIPLVAAALFALAVTVGPEAHAAAQDGMITIGNTNAPPGDACTASVHNSTLTQLKILTLAQWGEACEIATKAKHGAGIKGSVDVKIKHGKTSTKKKQSD